MTYMPHFETETDVPSPWRDCSWASLSMLLDKWTKGHVIAHHAALRRASGDKGGSGPPELQKAIFNYPKTKGWLLSAPSLQWKGVVDLVNSGRALVLMGQYGAIRGYNKGHYVRWDKRFALKAYSGHAVYVQRDGPKGALKPGYWWWMDPLGRGTYKGEWVPLNVIRSFAMALRHPNGTHLINAAAEGAKAPKPKPPITGGGNQGVSDMIVAGGLVITSNYYIPVKKGTTFYSDAACTKPVTTAASDGSFEYYGVTPLNSISYAVEFTSGKPFSDGLKRPIIGYIKRSAGKPVAKPAIPPAAGTPEDEIQKRIDAAILADRKTAKAVETLTVVYPS